MMLLSYSGSLQRLSPALVFLRESEELKVRGTFSAKPVDTPMDAW